ncbi:cilia- and flagella-associated protein 44-like isoform X9 [Mytilus californianus]|uniref:cilia- and flagella-associated protein 44-like isoform X8 n=1 Tax=Mytilus californianus TaxID=6549 RepID=UPI002247906B|nr:cilia- and flagella-associated protein 44-like isoform X8 [Mytilus californianus]XP_052060230.1 cilia- and flagella-associated protein 44-like isoform X9 [Mytilus californianus]
MDGEGDKSSPKPDETGADLWKAKKSKNLKHATSHLRAEALRRYRIKHEDDPEYEPPQTAKGDKSVIKEGDNSKAGESISMAPILSPVSQQSGGNTAKDRRETFSREKVLPPIQPDDYLSDEGTFNTRQDKTYTGDVDPNVGHNELQTSVGQVDTFEAKAKTKPPSVQKEKQSYLDKDLLDKTEKPKDEENVTSKDKEHQNGSQVVPTASESLLRKERIIVYEGNSGSLDNKESVSNLEKTEPRLEQPEKENHENESNIAKDVSTKLDTKNDERRSTNKGLISIGLQDTQQRTNKTEIDNQNFEERNIYKDDIRKQQMPTEEWRESATEMKADKRSIEGPQDQEILTFDIDRPFIQEAEPQKETSDTNGTTEEAKTEQPTESKPQTEGDQIKQEEKPVEESIAKDSESQEQEVKPTEGETTAPTEQTKDETLETKPDEGTTAEGKAPEVQKQEETTQETQQEGEKKEAEKSEAKEEVKTDEGEKKEGAEGEKKEAEGEKKEDEGAKKDEGEKKEDEGVKKEDEGQKKEEEGQKKEEEGQKIEEEEQKKEEEGQKKEEEGQKKEDREGEKKGEDEEGKEDGDDKKDKDGEADTNQSAKEGVEEEKETDESEHKKEKKKDTEKTIADDFFYDYETFVSKATVSEGSGLPQDMLSLQYSFGYDCTKRNNLHLLDDHTVCFAAGNLVQILDLITKEQKYLRSTSGGGIGAITVHPSQKYFAVGEKGHTPNINIFEYPSLKLYRILRGGTEKSYASLNFSPDGNLLASQGGDPDFMLTLWEWKKEQTVLRYKAFSQDVFRVTFSADLEGQLTTAGTSHIRFWKMADTFTGLKLQGQLGKFGRTEITDIEGYVELPDGKVLSGAEWGNMLLWEGGLIKVEITRKGKKSCHQGPIEQILLDEGELITVGSDGYIRVWDFESIDTADTTDDSATFEMEPMNELKVGNDVNLKSIIKCTDAENEITVWYAQDANGGIWKLDLSFSHTSSAPEKMFTYHAGAILGCDISPESHLVASTGVDQTVRLFDYVQRKQICEKKYASKGSALLWAPKLVDTKCATVIAGFQDGVVRVLAIKQLDEESLHSKRHKNSVELDIIQAFKPHSKSVVSIATDHAGEILATGGEDSTVFFMNINGLSYEPIGFVQVPAPVRKVQWSPGRFKRSTLLVFCEEGYVVEIDSPEGAKFDTSHTYHITGLPMKQYQFKSIKSKVRHEEELEKKRIEEAARKKKEEDDRRRRIERGLETESEQGDEPEGKKEPEPEWHPYIPENASPILTGYYSDEGKFWLSMGEFDAGYLYECKFLNEAEKAGLPEEVHDEPIRYVPVLESNDVPIHNITFSNNGKQVLFGMEDGAIRIHSVDVEFDISTLNFFWQLNIHDNNYGHLTGLKLGYDALSLISVGADGNFFMYNVMTQENLDKKIAEAKAKLPSAKKKDDDKVGDDIDDPSAYSIEDAKQKAEYDKMMKLAEEKKREVRRQISKFRRQFKGLLEKNEGLPMNIQLKKEEFEMDREIKEELQKQRDERIEIVRKELAWESEKQRIALEKLRKRYKDVVECERIVVKAFETSHEVASFRAAKLSDDFYHMKAEFERRKTNMTREDLTRDPTRELMTGQTRLTEMGTDAGGKQDDATAKVTTTTTLKGSMGERISKALGKVEEKKKKRAQRRAQWDDLYSTKPEDDFEDPNDVASIKEAKDNMGYFNLKTAKDYIVPDHLRMNVEKARGRLLVLKDLIHEYKYNFNLKLLSLRDKKIQIIEEIKDVVCNLKEVRQKLDDTNRKTIPPVPEMQLCEMPEKKLEYTRETLIKFKKEYEQQQKASKGSSTGGFGGFGGFGGETKAVSPTPARLVSETKAKTDSASSEVLEDVELTPLEIKLKQAEDIKMLYEQDRLLNRINELVQNFDAELRILRHEKFKLDIVMKNADLRQVTLFEELVLLKEFEKREDVLAEKVTNKAQEKIDMQNKIVEITNKIEMKKKEIEKMGEKDRALQAQFLVLLGDKNQRAEYLTKVYKKKIKRAKKKVSEDDESEESDDDSDDDSEWDEDEDESDDDAGGYDLDICPPGCDQTLYDNTCAMREKRLDIEEALVEEKKNNETLKKELESMNKKLKVIIGALKTAQNDLEAFQLEK